MQLRPTARALRRLSAFLRKETDATGLPLYRLLAVSAVFHVVILLAAVNPFSADEHFQVLEFAYARAGYAPLDALPWEYEARIRSSVHPVLAMAPLILLRTLGVQGPFAWILILKVGSLIAAAGVMLHVIARVSPGLSRSGRRVLWLSSLFLWFLPLLHFRFTGENLGGMALVAAVPLVLASETDPRRRISASAGLLLGLSFVFRFQMAFAVLGLLAWIVLRGAGGWRHGATLAAYAALVVALGSVVDVWFYGGWVFTPWSYFQVNIIEGVASSFGTEPWYWYLAGLPLWMAPPLGVALTLALFLPLFSRPSSVWVWIAAAFFLGHTVVGHKELRFLFPLIYLVPVLLALSTQAVVGWIGARPWARWTLGALAAQNVMLLFLLLTPFPHRATDLDGHFLRFLWHRAEEAEGAPVFVLSEGPGAYQVWEPWDLSLEVYRHPQIRDVSYTRGTDVAGLVPADTPPRRLLVLTRGNVPPDLAGAAATSLVYRAEPGYMPLIRLSGLEDSPFEARLRRLASWADSAEWHRRIWEVQLSGRPSDRDAPATDRR